MSLLTKVESKAKAILSSGSGEAQRPRLSKHRESNVPGLFVIGDLAGAPVIKMAMAQGQEIIDHISALPDAVGGDPDVYDVLVVGAGAAGLNAALAARDKGMSCLVLEKEKIANTIENFPEGKWVYAEPDQVPPKGKLWLDGATKEDLIARWHQIVEENHLDLRTNEPLVAVERRSNGIFEAKTPKGSYLARRIVLSTGQRGTPRKLGVPGEDQRRIYHRLYSPKKYRDENILVVGGGNSAVEAAVTLSKQNRVILSYRGSEFRRVFKDNEQQLNERIAAGAVEPVLNSQVVEFSQKEAVLRIDRGGHEETRRVSFDHAFVLIGADAPVRFLKSLGIRMENEWTGSLFRGALLALLTLFGMWLLGGKAVLGPLNLSGFVPGWVGALLALGSVGLLLRLGVGGDRFAWLGFSFVVWYSIYGIKVGQGQEFWPYRDWGYKAMSFLDRPWSFWYTVLYTVVMTLFGIQALKRWGLDRKDRFQIWRYVSLLSFQWIFFFIIPEFLFQWAVKYQWVGQKLASDPAFAEQAWRSYGLVYAWPLFFYTFFYNPHWIWVLWGVMLTLVLIPIFVIFHGKRYCSWICGCGGLAETFGDRWRHLAPKGKTSIKWEWMNTAVFVFAIAITGLMLIRGIYHAITGTASVGVQLYRILADVWLVGILPVTLYPFLGGKVWCRYWCPLAKMMHIFSKFYTKAGVSKFKITANDKCIACYECTRNCQVGIDVMSYALKQEVLDNENSSCIGCGICVTVCPMDTLKFGDQPKVVIPSQEVKLKEMAMG